MSNLTWTNILAQIVITANYNKAISNNIWLIDESAKKDGCITYFNIILIKLSKMLIWIAIKANNNEVVNDNDNWNQNCLCLKILKNCLSPIDILTKALF